MKKTLTIITLFTLVIASVFAKSVDVNLGSTIVETDVTYQLVYNWDIIEDGTTSYDINILSPLTHRGNTNPFLIYATSNMNKDLAIDVDVSPESFKTTVNNGSKVIDSNIVPSVFTPLSYGYLPAGKNTNLIIHAFILFWNGDTSLVAGDYVSNVKIEYSIY